MDPDLVPPKEQDKELGKDQMNVLVIEQEQEQEQLPSARSSGSDTPSK